MVTESRSRRWFSHTVKTAIAVASIATLTACSSATSVAADASTSSSTAKTTVRLILDWTPNTNHSGVYAALANGYYDDAGIDLEILPYSQSGVESVLASGGADFGFSGSTSATVASAAGLPLKVVEIVLQKNATLIGYREGRTDITTPKDLDGKIYAGFGLPWEEALVKQVITADGGTGDFTSVSLSTSAYDAVYSGAADFAEPLVTWEGIEAQLNGTPFSYFDPSDYGVPDNYTLSISGSDSFLEANPDVATAFVQATQKGYEWAAANPDEAASILIDANPDLANNSDLVYQSQELLSSDYYVASDGRVGFADFGIGQAYSDWLFKTGSLSDANGNALTSAPNAEDIYTNEYLAE